MPTKKSSAKRYLMITGKNKTIVQAKGLSIVGAKKAAGEYATKFKGNAVVGTANGGKVTIIGNSPISMKHLRSLITEHRLLALNDNKELTTMYYVYCPNHGRRLKDPETGKVFKTFDHSEAERFIDQHYVETGGSVSGHLASIETEMS